MVHISLSLFSGVRAHPNVGVYSICQWVETTQATLIWPSWCPLIHGIIAAGFLFGSDMRKTTIRHRYARVIRHMH